MSPLATLGTILVLALAIATYGCHSERRAHAQTQMQLAAAQANERATAAQWELAGLKLQGELRTCQAQWADLNERATREVQRAIAGRLQAEKALAEFQRRWSERSPNCDAALVQAERACPELEGY